MHSNVTSKIVVGFTLRGPPCIWLSVWLSAHSYISETTCPNQEIFYVC